MSIFNFFRFNKSRKDRVIEACGNVCYCPKCKDILNDQAICTPDVMEPGAYFYECNCKNISRWHFGIAPVPICLEKFVKIKELNENDPK